MNIKKVLLILIIGVAVIASASAVSAGFLDGLFGEEQHDNVIQIENITFNTTNVSSFKLWNGTDIYGVHANGYVDENDSGYNVHIINCSNIEGISFEEFIQSYLTEFDNSPSQTINGAVIYTLSADSGEHVGEPRYVSYVKNKDLQTLVEISSPDANETAKMILSLKFK
ncbi:hypothetical protein [uncultured Methanobrevibacter sp.]|uniref:hypothetical protein n=1 Tax=uncultured Methanobrevibacter sp. TaxID=253161 RepID=UPI0025DAB902|nr:hypothetical protein [uncultured Methanobrevibacter sp.]